MSINMETKGGNVEDDSNKDSRPSEEIKLSNDKSIDNGQVTNIDDPNMNRIIKSDEMESEQKQEKDQKEKEHIEESNHVKEHHNAANGDIEMKFVLDNKHLHTALSIPGSRSGTPNTARKRKNRHLDEMNMAEMISLSGVESLCTISNYDAMSTRGFDDDEEGGEQEEEKVDEGIGVHHVLSVLLAMMSVAIVLLLYFLVPCPMEPANWSVQMEGIVASSPVRLLDLNRDGMDDVIFGFSIGKSTNPPEVVAQLCENLNFSSSCGGGVIAMSGWRGEVLWRLDMIQVNHTSISSLVCNQLDVNEDGQLDCLAAGNNGLLLAINTKTGHILWEADPSVTVPAWTYSQPQTLPRDLDDDGVLDLVVTHGAISEGTHDEDEAGRVVLLSGKTGQSLGTFLEMPDGHASVSPPIVFQASDDQEATPYVVFGSGAVSGSESSNPGSMWMIPLDRLLCHVTGSNCVTSTPSVEQRQPAESHVTSIHDYVVELVRGSGDGFLLPAIVADMTMDGVNDLIIVSHDALITAINGSSFKPLWSRQLDVGSVYRPYSVLAPGHFNHDEVPDLMIQLGPHEYSSNTTSHTNKMMILDGLTGEELWHTVTKSSFDNQPVASRPSPISLKGNKEKDAFTFWLEDLPVQEDGTTTKSNIDRCSDLISRYPTLNLVMMDRDMAMDPSSLISFKPYKPITSTQSSIPSSDATTNQPISTTAASHMTSLPAREASSTVVLDVTPLLGGDLSPSSIPLNASTNPMSEPSSSSSSSTLLPGRVRRSNSEDCFMMEPILTSTGVIEDLDDDGSLELIVAINMMSTYLGSSANPSIDLQGHITIQRISLERALDQNKRIQLVQTDSFLSPSVENATISGTIFDHFDLLETKLQTWLGYMGTKADGRYT